MTPANKTAVAPTRAPASTGRLFVAGAAAGHRAHLAAYGPAPSTANAVGLIRELESSGLTGRGGAGFQVWRKFAATDDARRRRRVLGSPVVIANGAEGEPKSFKDATLLRNSPHLVIDGLLVAAAAVSASQVYLYAAPANLVAVSRAIAERRDAARIRLVEAPDTFVAGEASAAVNAIENGRASCRERVCHNV